MRVEVVGPREGPSSVSPSQFPGSPVIRPGGPASDLPDDSSVRGDPVVEELRRANQQLVVSGIRDHELAEKAELRAAWWVAILDGLDEGVVVADANGRIQLVNQAAKTILGQPDLTNVATQTELAAKVTLQSLDGSPLPPNERPLARALKGELFSHYDVVLVRPDGVRRVLTCSGTTVRGETGPAVLASCVFRDVSELRQLEGLRQDYVSLVAHDLRNPLGSMMGWSGLLRRQLAKPDLVGAEKSASAVARSARQMNRMIETLLDTARLESSDAELRLEPTDLVALIRDAIAAMVSDPDQARLAMEADDSLPLVAIDRDRIEHVVVNLIGNALKYSEPNTPVTIQVHRKIADVVVAVVDRGVGISPEDLPHVFDKFFRTGAGRARGGVGLGLYFVRLIVEASGGQVWAVSEPGQGTTFCFSLPLDINETRERTDPGPD